MVSEIKKYFESFSENRRTIVKDIIRDLCRDYRLHRDHAENAGDMMRAMVAK